MTAYEFTRFESDFTSKMKAQAYDADTVKFQIEYAHKTSDIRGEAEYSDAENVFTELTMSCNMNEAIRWMQYWMANAIAYGIQTKNRDWQHKFLAAYDIFNRLCPLRTSSNRFAKFNQTC